jgi:EmrB/QacA subfamily drug resistance transporter
MSASPAPALTAGAAQTTPPPHRQRVILSVLIFAQLLIWLDGTILGTAYETLADPVRGLGATPGQLQWATGSYTLVLATVTFTGGALGDRFGHRSILLTGMALFGLASVAAAYSHSAGGLIAARAVMGAGAALLVPATMAVVSWTFEPAKRPAAFGTLSSFAGLGIAAGPILAGLLLARFWWGSVFLVNVPVVLAGLAFIAKYVPNFKSPQARRLDPTGLVLSTTGLGLLAYGLIRAGQDGSLTEPAVWGCVGAAVLLIAAFIAVELRVEHPSFNPRLLAQRRFALGNATLTMVFLSFTAGSFYNAFYLQGARQYSALHASLLALPGALGVMVGAPTAVKLVRRTSVRLVGTSALGVATLTMASFSTFGLHTPVPLYMAVSVVQGTAIGMVIAPVTGAVLGSLPLAQAGAGSAVNNTLRQTGSVLGIAVGGTVMSIVYRRGIDGHLAGLSPVEQGKASTSAELARHLAAVRRDQSLADQADRAFLHAMHVGSIWSALFMLIGGVLAFVGFSASKNPVTPPAGAPQPAAAPRPEAPLDPPQPRTPAAGTAPAAQPQSSGSRR